MGPVLKLMVLSTILIGIVALIMMAITSAKKRQLREKLDALPFDQLQHQARELQRRDGVLTDVFRTRASSASMYGSEGEALAEALMRSVFADPDAVEERYPSLLAHYRWLLALLARYMEAKWVWTEMPVEPSLKRHQVCVQDPDSGIQHFPRPQEGVFGLELNETLRWLGTFATQHGELVGQHGRSYPVLSWNADLFKLKVEYRTFGISNLSLYQIQCPPSLLRREIERLTPAQGGLSTA